VQTKEIAGMQAGRHLAGTAGRQCSTQVLPETADPGRNGTHGAVLRQAVREPRQSRQAPRKICRESSRRQVTVW